MHGKVYFSKMKGTMHGNNTWKRRFLQNERNNAVFKLNLLIYTILYQGQQTPMGVLCQN